MPTNYCPSCGTGNKYELTAPKFCSECGSGFDTVAVAKSSVSIVTNPKPKPKLVPYGKNEDDDGYDEDGESSGTLRIPRKLDVEIIVDKPERRTLGSIMRGSATEIEIDKGTGRRLSKRAIKEKVGQWRETLQKTQRHDIGGQAGPE